MLLKCGVGKDSWESLGWQGDQTSPSKRKSVLNIHWKYWCSGWNSNTLATWCEELILRKDPDGGKDWGQEEKGTTEDGMVGWHHRLNGYEFEQTSGDSEGQENLACCSPWGHKDSDMTEQLNSNIWSSPGRSWYMTQISWIVSLVSTVFNFSKEVMSRFIYFLGFFFFYFWFKFS